jgi:autotransporter passenger strand-loop-strand repeat protein
VSSSGTASGTAVSGGNSLQSVESAGTAIGTMLGSGGEQTVVGRPTPEQDKSR